MKIKAPSQLNIQSPSREELNPIDCPSSPQDGFNFNFEQNADPNNQNENMSHAAENNDS